ncbi:hypothetical protein O3P69_001374 [Scylla paramamosain]|uniref:Uncharacterized protein n=1 Tax=Scylla paramamosain TaxID=85552 RepID=A0AAW0URB4_SCYPA
MVFKQLLDRVESGAPLSSGARWHSRFIKLLPRGEGSRLPRHAGRAPPTLRGGAQGRDWPWDAARGMSPSFSQRSRNLKRVYRYLATLRPWRHIRWGFAAYTGDDEKQITATINKMRPR